MEKKKETAPQEGKNILFFIGNGFDINLGLATRYTDFLEWYKKQPTDAVLSAEAIERIKRELDEDLKIGGRNLWANMEEYLGARLINDLLAVETPEESVHIKEDIDASLKKYLKEVYKAFNYAPSLTKILLQDIIRLKICLGECGNPSEDIFFSRFSDTLRFVDFNYTETLDKIVDGWGEVLHIHERIDNLILGVDANRQIPGDSYADEADLLRKYVKQDIINAENKRKWQQWIREADCICFFGVSFGKTDKTYWLEVLKSNKKMVAFEYDPKHRREEKLKATLLGVFPDRRYSSVINGITWIPTGSGGDFWDAMSPREIAVARLEELTFRVEGVEFRMIPVEGGTFRMGATAEQGDDAFTNEMPAHNVTLSAYHIGETEVTQALWKAVMASEPTENGGWTDACGKGDDYPAYRVSWEDCQDFIDKLNAKLSGRLKGMKFALPTEAQWENAARGGKRSKGYKYSGGNTIGNVAWYEGNSGNKTHAVKGKQPNELGLYDMNGNVWEWCSDWYGDYSSDAQTDPVGPSSGDDRVSRGGSWYYDARSCRVSFRNYNYPSFRYYDLGFRLVLLP